MKSIFYFSLLFFSVCKINGFYENQPKLLSSDGNFVLESAQDKNITLRIKGRGSVRINDIDLLKVLDASSNFSSPSLNVRAIAQIRNRLEMLFQDVRGGRPRGLIFRMNRLENSTRDTGGSNIRFRALNRKVTALETKVNLLMAKISEDNCRSNPCQNGGTCITIYNGFICQCPPTWEGVSCERDVNECAHFVGTDLGCQNGATCINTRGGYNCICASGYQGIHCTKKNADCITSGTELCGHGTCVQTNDGVGYKCLCDQGWTTNGVTPPCTVDIDECTTSKPHCSKDPEVSCINMPGSFGCGPCPAGFTGNGFYCVDINECETNNGGCSISPYVTCTNTRGSFSCGNCPPGYQGNGKSCVRQGIGGMCTNNNFCHPMARCVEYGNNVVNCICQSGYVGDGFGPSGCAISDNDPCGRNPCQNGGTCRVNGTSFACSCPSGTSPPLCSRNIDPCDSNPCLHGGSCTSTGSRSFRCVCPNTYTGNLCQTEARACGGVLNSQSGTLKYPVDANGTYGHNVRCAWLIKTDASKVLNVTFTKFNLEESRECLFDWLQIHDGRSSGYHMIGRFCGNNLPKGGNIISTHQFLYFWFRSDNSMARDGFELNWESIDPVCGGQFETRTYGVIASPGSPGNYPPNRDCYWTISAPPGKRLQFHFFTLKLEAHVNCGYDFLSVHSGTSTEGEILEKYCNTSHPEPLITPSNEVTLHFHSDEDATDAGFQIHYTVVEGFPGCGGTFTATSGEFGSPLEDGSYPHNMVCEYLIRLPTNNRVKIEFKLFHLEESEDCRFDFLEMYEGSTDQSPLIRRMCGNEIPESYVSQSNIVLIKFKSDWSNSHEGFRLYYQIVCGGTFEEPEGVIQSPLYPNSYEESRICEYEIRAPPGKAIVLSFLDFDLEGNSQPECLYDYVQVFNGMQSNQTEMGRYCGETIPDTIISDYNILFLKFETDSSINGRGFKANYSTIDVACGGIINTPGSVIKPPIEEGKTTYTHDSKCTWVIIAPPGNVIQLSWLSFDLEDQTSCSYDFVAIYDNSTSNNQQIGKYCGTTIPPSIISMGNIVTIKFETDSSSSRDGFTLSYSFVEAGKLCGGKYFTTSGYIHSPGWPKEYVSNKECEWFITVPTGQQIELNVLSFSIEGHSECRFDYLEIRNGGSMNSPLIGKFCGTDILPKIKSFTNQLYLKFVSDSSRTGPGFEIEWDGTATGCGGLLTSSRGSISSPNYPQPYGENAQCVWKIIVSAGSSIQFVFIDLDLEEHASCHFDYLEIFDGKDASSKSLGKFCASNNHPLQIETSSNFAYIRMKSDSSNQGRGFNLKYNINCRREVKGHNGIIESPNFPNFYPHSLDCEWTLRAPIGNNLNVEFLHFDIENSQTEENGKHVCNFDYLEIEQRDNEQIVNKEKYCNKAPTAFTTSKDIAVFRFHTDSSTTHSGFRLEWLVEGCGGVFTHPTGEFTSPNYPDVYPLNTHCYWTIIVEYGNSIEVTVHDFDMESSTDCKFDGLIIANGDNESQPITTLCHTQITPVVVTGNGHKMFIKFFSDFSHNKKGFKASYKTIPIQCGGILTKRGNLTSPNYPNNYGKNLNCEWIIQTDDTHRLELKLEDFDIESSLLCSADVLTIYDGHERDEKKLLLNHCGTSLPNQTNYVSSTNKVLVIFKTNSNFESKGFRLTFKTACGTKIIATDTGTISRATSLLDFAQNCTWIITTEDPSKHITFTTTYLVPVPEADQCLLNIYDGDSEDSSLIASYCEAPPAISSAGNSLTISYISPISYPLLGLDFEATYSVFENACGGTLTSVGGKFATPGYPHSYPDNVECVWNIIASPGSKMMVSFTLLDIEKSDGCNEDYLEIRENSESGRVLGIFCGNEIPSNLTASEKIWIKFRSNNDVNGQGFLAEYYYLKDNEIYGDSGMIASPMYPKFMLKSPGFTRRITVPFGSIISIRFIDIYIHKDLDICFNYIKIYDGYDDTAPILKDDICGWNIPEPAISSSNVVLIEGSFNAMFTGDRFVMEWKKISKSEVNTEEVDSRCEDSFVTIYVNTTNTNISSPGYPYGYDTRLNCSWTIASEKNIYHPVLMLRDVDLEDSPLCTADSVKVFSSEDMQKWNLLDTVCNLDSRNNRYYHGTPYLKVNFLSDFMLNKTGFSGNIFLECGGMLTEPNGVISITSIFNSFAGRSPKLSTVCMWNITVRQGRTIQFEFETFVLPKNRENVACDGYLLFKNGKNDDSPLLGDGKYCGETIPIIPPTISNNAFVKFNYGGNFRNEFILKYHEVSIECGGNTLLTYEYNSTEITSPNYPNIPHPHTECVWSIMAPGGETIQVDFIERFDLTSSDTCDKEYVEVRDGGTKNSRLVGTYCKGMPESIRTTSNLLRLKYFTDVNDPKNGFKARISITVCGGIYRQIEGIVSSPNYPGKGAYPANSICEYRIVGKPGAFLNISFIDLHLPMGVEDCNSTDHVEIYSIIPDETGSSKELLKGIYCGNSLPESFFTDGNEMLIRFQTFHQNELFRGFSLKYNSSKEICGGKFNAESGILTSPGYPQSRQNRRFCEWEITVPKNKRVKVELIDFDLIPATNTYNQRLGFYNDHKYMTRIAFLKGDDPLQTIYSSGNKMLINMWVRTPSNHRGFKLRYSSDEPSLCVGDLNRDFGIIASPSNQSTFYCEYLRDAGPFYPATPNQGTLSIRLTDFRQTVMRPSLACRIVTTKLTISWTSSPNRESEVLAHLCGNLTNTIIRSPFPDTRIEAKQGPFYGNMTYTLDHKINNCGGILKSAAVIQHPNFTNYDGSVDCAWSIQQSNGNNMNVEISAIHLTKPCDQEYIQIFNGAVPLSPMISKICGSQSSINTFQSGKNYLFIEYHSDSYSADTNFRINVVPVVSGCGGIIHKTTPIIKSPGNTSYPNNVECIWEIIPDVGYHVGLEFIDRFFIEDSVNCTKDYLEIFDMRNSEWVSLGRVCGRDKPPVFNATETKLKLVFRTDERTSGDGFTVKWYQNCGGIYQATESLQVISSPGHPLNYGNLLNCNYSIVAPKDKFISLDFKHFVLEDAIGKCFFDNLTIYKVMEYVIPQKMEETGVYCRRDSPGQLRFKSQVDLVFKTDRWIEKSGFLFEYQIDSCGGTITESTNIESPMEGTTYSSQLDCVWNITAPYSKKIVIRFESFTTEYSESCYYDYVDIYSGNKIDDSNRLARLCGNLTQLPAIKVEKPDAILTFKTDGSNHFGGWSAAILFVAACDRKIELTKAAPSYTLSVTPSNYEDLLDCHYVVKAPEGYAITMKFNQFHVAPCQANSTSSKCSCDYLEVRDGGGPFSNLIGTYCGYDLPDDIISSRPLLYIRFVTDSLVKSTGFDILLTAKETACGQGFFNITDGPKIIQTPGEIYPSNLKCTWTIIAPQYKSIGLHFEKLDLEGPDENGLCTLDSLEIVDSTVNSHITEGLGQDTIFNGIKGSSTDVPFYLGTRQPTAHHHYCGTGTPADYYSSSDKVFITFKSDAQIEATGFRIVARTTNTCHRNYTSTQGRIMSSETKQCAFYITAPENYTISVYFSNIMFYNMDCEKNGMRFYEGGPDGRLITKLCGYVAPDPIFSNTNIMYIKTIGDNDGSFLSGGSYDFTYLATDQGQGCGGTLFNYGGIFSSPFYPANDRNNSDCRWDIIIPNNLKVGIKFEVFDMGSRGSCDTNYLQIVEIDGTVERIARQYCGDDKPTNYKSEKSTLTIRFKKNVNFSGTGWLIKFMSIYPDANLLDW